MRVALLGCGNVGRIIAKAIKEGEVDHELVGVFDIDEDRAKRLSNEFGGKVIIAGNVDELIMKVDLVVEAASQRAVQEHALSILEGGKDIMILSVGALVDEDFLEEVKDRARKNNSKVYIPSGAVIGLDGINSAKQSDIGSVSLTTTKRPGVLGTTKNKKTVLYDGPAREAVKRFPENINVAATISLAGVGFDETRVRVVADPDIKRNIHEIHVVGGFGEFKVTVENVPSPQNPKTSYLAALSAIATLKRISNPLQIGN